MPQRSDRALQYFGVLRLLPLILICLFLFCASTDTQAQKTSKEVKRELRKEKRKKARKTARLKREQALYADGDFYDDEDSVRHTQSLEEKEPAIISDLDVPLEELLDESAAISVEDRITLYASTLQGIPYRYGGMSTDGFDCSGFSCHVFSNDGVQIPRTAQAQFNASLEISLRKAQKGDLLFFGKNKGKIEHVGIVISEQGEPLKMIHSGSSTGIIITDVKAIRYWDDRLIAAGRYPLDR